MWECYHFEVTGDTTIPGGKKITFYNRAQLSGDPRDFALYLAAYAEGVMDIYSNTTVGEIDVTYLVLNNNLTHAHTKLDMVIALGETLADAIVVSGIVVVDISGGIAGGDANVTLPFESLAITVGGAGAGARLVGMGADVCVGVRWCRCCF